MDGGQLSYKKHQKDHQHLQKKYNNKCTYDFQIL